MYDIHQVRMFRGVLPAVCVAIAAGCASPAAVRSGAHLEPPAGATVMEVEGLTIWLDGELEALAAGADGIEQWVRRSVAEVTRFYGRAPESRLRISVRRGRGGGVGFASVRSEPDMPRIRINVGAHCTPAALARDWVLVHELVHLAYPAQAREHHWMEEGLATYIEPLCGAASGRLSAEELWGTMVRKMPHGLPVAGDQGLDRTPTWGRTYWGGALFCLVADVEIRKRSGNRAGLRHAMRGVVEAGGRMSWHWPMRKALQTADRASGHPVLWELYEAWKHTPVAVDLQALWRDLGVVNGPGGITFDDDAPLAHIRRAITDCAREP